MYTREQTAKQRQKFWTNFGQYMKPVPNANGESINWLNYKTGIRNIIFRMDAGNQQASITIELRHIPDKKRLHYYNQFIALKKLLENTTHYQWNWQPVAINENGETISSISQTINGVNVMNEEDWPTIISFLKPRILALDSFWELVKDGFE